jgi:flagellar biogenesis protein FliO
MKHNGGTGGSRGIRILDSRHLSAKSNIALVEIPGKILVVGVGQEHICLLDKIENPEQINEIKSAESLKRQAPFAGQFHRIFSELMKKKRFE